MHESDMNPEAATRISVVALRQFIAASFRKLGLPDDDALTVATLMAEADLQGSDGHGVIRLPQYARRIRGGGMNLRPVMRVVTERAGMALIDGDNAMGHLVMSRAAELAVSKARSAGVAWVGTRMSNHSGPASLYARKMLAQDMIGMVLRGRQRQPSSAMGQELDMLPVDQPDCGRGARGSACGHRARHGDDGRRVRQGQGESAAPGRAHARRPWMIDREGRPLTDPRRADEDFLLPIGGYKDTALR